jgi:hypothetical protein
VGAGDAVEVFGEQAAKTSSAAHVPRRADFERDIRPDRITT